MITNMTTASTAQPTSSGQVSIESSDTQESAYRRHVCPECARVFSTAWKLNRHLNSHIMVECPVCEGKFSRHAFNRHKTRHHPEHYKSEHRCECGRHFDTFQSLGRHRSRMQHSRPERTLSTPPGSPLDTSFLSDSDDAPESEYKPTVTFSACESEHHEPST